MARLRYNGLTATLGGTGLTSSATTVTFAAALTHSGGTAVPTIAGSDYIPLSILDASGNLAEIVYLTAYTSGTTTGTITRAQESTTAGAHSSGDRVLNGLTVSDVSGATGDASWHLIGAAGEPAFENGFSNFGAGYSSCKFRKLSSGLVLIRGLVKKGTAGSSVANLSVFTLPAGYRPGENMMLSTFCEQNPSTTPRVDVLNTGVVRIVAGTSGFTSLDNISFYAEA